MSAQQASLVSLGLRRSSTTGSSDSATAAVDEGTGRDSHFLAKVLDKTGPLVRLSEPVFKLFERVHLVFYRSTEWTEKSLTTIILAKISRRNFPEYLVCRSFNIFGSRRSLLEFEQSIRLEHQVDIILETGPVREDGFQKVLGIFEGVAARWRELMRHELAKEEQDAYQYGEGAYLRRFNAAHAYTRIAHKVGYVMGRLKQYGEEHALLTELLGQRLFHPARRGSWYQRKALLEEHYMWAVEAEAGAGTDFMDSGRDTNPPTDANAEEQRKKYWRRQAVATCEKALEDRDCHLIYHYDLQKRLVKLERRLRIPRRLQHDFGHVKLRQPEEHTVYGIQLLQDELTRARAGKLGGPSTKTYWLDSEDNSATEVRQDGEAPAVSVEEMCLSHYRSQGWKGYHAEGGIVRTLFAYLFFDILFVYIPNVFQTAYQTCPLDLHTDAFYPARASEINHRLVEIANGEAERILREVDGRERERRTCVVGLNWDYDVEDLAELVRSFDGEALATVCKVMAQEYGARGGGVPDLLLWRAGEVMFSEVKSANDHLSDTQRLWIHVLTGAGVRVALCNAVAKETRQLA
jgi:Fanconi-associated nuclease 1